MSEEEITTVYSYIHNNTCTTPRAIYLDISINLNKLDSPISSNGYSLLAARGIEVFLVSVFRGLDLPDRTTIHDHELYISDNICTRPPTAPPDEVDDVVYYHDLAEDFFHENLTQFCSRTESILDDLFLENRESIHFEHWESLYLK